MALLGGVCAAHAADEQSAIKTDATRPLRVVATIFPAYDWAREVIGTNAAGETYLVAMRRNLAALAEALK